MREVINISLPNYLAIKVRKTVKKEGFASTSEFFRHLLRLWLEEKTLSGLKKSREEIILGKGKVLRSLKNLR